MGWVTDLVRTAACKLVGPKQDVVVSETDIEATLNYLRTLPYRSSLPASWDRLRLLRYLRDTIGKCPRINHYYDVAPGVFAIIKPFGVDLAAHLNLPGIAEFDGRLQIWLLIRSCHTDPARTTRL